MGPSFPSFSADLLVEICLNKSSALQKTKRARKLITHQINFTGVDLKTNSNWHWLSDCLGFCLFLSKTWLKLMSWQFRVLWFHQQCSALCQLYYYHNTQKVTHCYSGSLLLCHCCCLCPVAQLFSNLFYVVNATWRWQTPHMHWCRTA